MGVELIVSDSLVEETRFLLVGLERRLSKIPEMSGEVGRWIGYIALYMRAISGRMESRGSD